MLEQQPFSYEYTRLLFGSEKLVEAMKTAIDNELDYCNFYLEYQKCLQDPNFNKWISLTDCSAGRVAGMFENTNQVWTKTNGRLKATITIKKGASSTTVSVKIENASKHVDFLREPYGGSKDLAPPAHLKNEKSIEDRVVTLQRDVDKYMEDHIMPYYWAEKAEEDILKKLLCVE